ncbi:MAG: LL-diaminopimelate aminotransferase [Candidatus Cloacimonetes bacterium]|nr:LL-diaminopimelate aminotransferase [Candidatus Cloacimonadota bacterium]
MATINKNYRKLASGYLFPEIARRTKAYQQANLDKKLHRLGIGNTTEALSSEIVNALHEKIDKLANNETYSGYGDEQGDLALREALVGYYKKMGIDIENDEVFVSDGAKPDSANIQSIFSSDSIVAIQDPAYPVYVDSNVVSGRSSGFDVANGVYKDFVYLKGNIENQFFPPPPKEKVDLIYLCSPNNPTGAVATKEQLEEYVSYAKKHKSVIIFDAAYNEFISDPNLPKSIYQIEGAKECAVEINSFSKFSGFTGVRLGWSIVPKELSVEDSEVGEINRLWFRRQVTFFNGASNISQAGGLAVLSDKGLAQSKALVAYYMENAQIIKETLQELSLDVYGGTNAPYLWVKAPNNLKSWEFFDQLLNQCQVVVTPGSGFGSSGEHFVRFSAFGHRQDILDAVKSIKENLKI